MNDFSKTAYTTRPILEGANILITGGAGFLGSHLADLLVSRGNHVYCLDNFHTGRLSNLAQLHPSNRLSVVEHDIKESIPDTLPVFSEIYNLACPASPVHYQSDPVSTAMINCQGAWNVLERARQDGSRVFHASTSEIYGDPEIHPQPESYWGNVNTVGPRSCYDEGKRFAETLFTDFGKMHGVTVRMVRIFNTYGPRMQPDDGRVVSNFISQALLGQPLTVYGDGQQTRSFCYVDDLIHGFDLLMRSEVADSPINLGNPGEFTMEELAHLVLEITGSSSPIVRLPLPIDDPKRRKPDITKAKNLFGWTPRVSLREGLIKTAEYFEAALKMQPTASAAE